MKFAVDQNNWPVDHVLQLTWMHAHGASFRRKIVVKYFVHCLMKKSRAEFQVKESHMEYIGGTAVLRCTF